MGDRRTLDFRYLFSIAEGLRDNVSRGNQANYSRGGGWEVSPLGASWLEHYEGFIMTRWPFASGCVTQ
jgi:hypothetical protein